MMKLFLLWALFFFSVIDNKCNKYVPVSHYNNTPEPLFGGVVVKRLCFTTAHRFPLHMIAPIRLR